MIFLGPPYLLFGANLLHSHVLLSCIIIYPNSYSGHYVIQPERENKEYILYITKGPVINAIQFNHSDQLFFIGFYFRKCRKCYNISIYVQLVIPKGPPQLLLLHLVYRILSTQIKSRKVCKNQSINKNL